jgi:acylphosphatase
MRKHLNIKITGRVQGVFFRASAKKEADARGIYGFVRNEPNGSVYVEAEGDENTLINFAAWCKQGPPSADVESCNVSEGILQHYRSFEIKR